MADTSTEKGTCSKQCLCDIVARWSLDGGDLLSFDCVRRHMYGEVVSVVTLTD